MASSPTTPHHDEKEPSIDPNGSVPSLSNGAVVDSEGRKLYGGASVIPMVSIHYYIS